MPKKSAKAPYSAAAAGRRSRPRQCSAAGSTNTQSTVFQEGDVSSKRIFENKTLCAQFLRDYSGIPQLKNVQPEDIEPVRLRYHIFAETELNADSAMCVRLKNSPEIPGSQDKIPLYIVPLIDHKNKVDYNVSMQLLIYMVCIWYDWGKRWKDHNPNTSHKDFVYPFILPIVYFEGTGQWTASLHLADRICLSDTLSRYVPDFTYLVVRSHDYSNEQLLENGDEMSLLMLLNKIQRAADIGPLRSIPSDRVNAIIRESPGSVIEILVGTVQQLCRKLNVSEKETAEYISRIEERNMGYLFENMEKMDIQAERKNTQDALRRAQEAEKHASEAEKRASEAESRASEAESRAREARSESVCRTIFSFRKLQMDRDTTRAEISRIFDLSPEDSEAEVDKYWATGWAEAVSKASASVTKPNAPATKLAD